MTTRMSAYQASLLILAAVSFVLAGACSAAAYLAAVLQLHRGYYRRLLTVAIGFFALAGACIWFAWHP